jgi:hypothetical protein
MAVIMVVPEASLTRTNVPGVTSLRLTRVSFMTRVLLLSCSMTEPIAVCTWTLPSLRLVILPAISSRCPFAKLVIVPIVMAKQSDNPAAAPSSILRFMLG